MPTYEYKCDSCGHQFEIFQSMNDAPITECSECKSGVRKLFGAGSGIIFKGSGFYVNDYKKGSAKGDCSSCKSGGCSD